MKRTTILGFCFTALVALAVWAPNVLAYTSRSECQSCHSLPSSTLHDLHRDTVSGSECSYCHNNSSVANSCAQCHDGEATRDFHIVNNYNSCGSNNTGCHYSPPPPTCTDNDGDGYGNPGDSTCRYSAEDCDDTDASINPGAVEDCTDNIDNNCNGKIDEADPDAVGCPIDCTDDDGDFYSLEGGHCGSVDCNDAEPLVNPGVSEDCTDGIDNDCDDQTDCDDSACSGEPACVLDFCEDYGDRGSCKADSRCSWSGKGKNCFEPVVYTQSECDELGGRWNKKKESCSIR